MGIGQFWNWKSVPATWLLAGLLLLVFIVQAIVMVSQGLEFHNRLFVFDSDWKAKPWTVVTSHIAHDPQLFEHLPGNMAILLLAAPPVERVAGKSGMLGIFLLAAVIASFVKLQQSGAASIGASGGLLAFVPLALAILLIRADPVEPRWASRMAAWSVPLIGVFFLFVPQLAVGLSHWAHWYGFAVGVALATCLAAWPRNPTLRSRIASALGD